MRVPAHRWAAEAGKSGLLINVAVPVRYLPYAELYTPPSCHPREPSIGPWTFKTKKKNHSFWNKSQGPSADLLLSLTTDASVHWPWQICDRQAQAALVGTNRRREGHTCTAVERTLPRKTRRPQFRPGQGSSLILRQEDQGVSWGRLNGRLAGLAFTFNTFWLVCLASAVHPPPRQTDS